jgi:TPR repeat protein
VAGYVALGEVYEMGLGVPEDPARAAQLYLQALERLEPGSMEDALVRTRLGAMYLEGRGVPQNDEQAAVHLRMAADSGRAEAQRAVGRLYANGWGVPQNHARAAEWFRRAADQGDAEGMILLAGMYLLGRGVEQDDAAARRLMARAAGTGDPNARFLAAVAPPGDLDQDEWLAVTAQRLSELGHEYLAQGDVATARELLETMRLLVAGRPETARFAEAIQNVADGQRGAPPAESSGLRQ